MKGVTEITVETLALATSRATETAYKAVMKPKEGTILTVAKGISDKAAEIASQTDDIEEAMRIIIEHAEYVLSKRHLIDASWSLKKRELWIQADRKHIRCLRKYIFSMFNNYTHSLFNIICL